MNPRTRAAFGIGGIAVFLFTFWAGVACWIVGDLDRARWFAIAAVASILVVLCAARLDTIDRR